MKKLLIGVGLLGVLAACTAEPAKVIPTPTTRSMQEVGYLNTLRTKYPEYNTVDDSLLVSTGKNICMSLDQGVPLIQIATRAVDPPLTEQMWGYNIGVAIGSFCPAHTKDVTELQSILGG